MRTSDELTEDELNELRETYFHQLIDGGDEEVLGDYTSADEIPISNVIAHYEGTFFVDEDFFCNIKPDYPFNEGDDYWTIEDGEVIWSCWDTVSEEIHDETPDQLYYSSEQEAINQLNKVI